MDFIFGNRYFDDHEQVVFCSDEAAGLRAIIAVHRTGERHALGGTRVLPYPSDKEALDDVLRLSRAMTYKSAMANLPYGGGKAVIIGDPANKSEQLLRAMGRAVDRLGGRFVTGEDVGIGVEDVEVMRGTTPHMVGEAGGDSSEPAAYGVFAGIRAAVEHRLEREDLGGLIVAVQGLGQVGYILCRYLHEAGAGLVVTDVHEEAVRRAVEEFGAKAVGIEEVYDQEVDVFSPCALGGVISDATLSRLKAGIVAGAANNQLASPKLDAALAERGVLYAPDYVVNAGGVINNAMQLEDYDRERVMRLSGKIHVTLLEVFRRADAEGIPTGRAADLIAEERMAREGAAQATAPAAASRQEA
jgi:leucine dehydrogenase